MTISAPRPSCIHPPPPTGTIKQGSLEQGLLKWDAHLKLKFSKAHGIGAIKWMTDSRETIRGAMVRRNKAILSQKKRDQQKSEPAPHKRPAAATPHGSKDRAYHQGRAQTHQGSRLESHAPLFQNIGRHTQIGIGFWIESLLQLLPGKGRR